MPGIEFDLYDTFVKGDILLSDAGDLGLFGDCRNPVPELAHKEGFSGSPFTEQAYGERRGNRPSGDEFGEGFDIALNTEQIGVRRNIGVKSDEASFQVHFIVGPAGSL